MKRRICMIGLIACLLIGSQGLMASGDETPPGGIRIGLAYGNGAVSSCTISGSSGLLIAEFDDEGFIDMLPLPAYTEVSVSMEATGFAVRDSAGTLLSADIGAKGCLLPLDYDTGGVLRYNDKAYRGGIGFFSNHNGTMNAVNCLLLDEYLYGVVNAEMGHGNPLEALKAQAVTARSFAIANRGMHSAQGFNLCATTHCQVYGGCAQEYAETTQAVDETTGLLMRSDGKIISGYYFKNSGGHTQSISEVWGSKAPYLVGIVDEYSPDYPWSATLSFAEIENKLLAAGHSIGTLEQISILSRNSAGAVSAVEFRGTWDSVTLKNEQVRSLFGYSVIKSTMFSLGNQSNGAKTNQTLVMLGNGESRQYGIEMPVVVMGAGGKMQKAPGEGLYVVGVGETVKIVKSAEGAAGQETTNTDPVVFSGKGYGHGIGMPQDSAIEMGKKGFTYEEILKYYYTGISIE